MVAGMVMPLGELKAIYELLFRDGVMVAKKDMRPQSKHPEVHGVTNLQVIKAMGSLKSRGYVRETFAWRHFYWYVTNEGIVYLRDFLRLPPEIVPSTLQRVRWPSTTLDVLRRAAHVQRVEGPTSYAPKPTSRSSVEKKESLMDRQGYRHRKKLTLEEEKQASMLKPRGSPRSFDPFKPRTSLELGSQSLASLKSGEKHDERQRSQGSQLKATSSFKASQPFLHENIKQTTSSTSAEKIVSEESEKIISKSVSDAVASKSMLLNAETFESGMLSSLHITQETDEQSSESIISKEALAPLLGEDPILTTVDDDEVQVEQEAPTSAKEEDILIQTPISEIDNPDKPSFAAVTQAICKTTHITTEPKSIPEEVDLIEVDDNTLESVSEVMTNEAEFMPSAETMPPTLSALEEQMEDVVLPNVVDESSDSLEINVMEEQTIDVAVLALDSAEEEAQGPAEDLIPEDTQLQTEQDAAIYSMNNKLDADLEMKVIESEAQMGEEKVEENTLDSIDAELVTSCEATEAAWMEDTAVHEDHVDVSEEAEQITPDLPLEEVTPDFALEEMTPDLPLGQITQDLALGQHSPDLTLEKVTPEIPLEQVTPDFTLDQVTPDFTLDQVTPDFTLDHVTPDFTLDHVTPDFTLEQVTPDFTLEQVTPDLTLGQFTSHLALEGETPVQVDEKQAEAPPFMVLPPEAKPEIPSDITNPSDVTAMKKKVFLAEELIDIQNGSTSNTAENVSELVNVTEVKMAHQEELDIEGEDSLIDIQEWTSLPEE